MINCDNVEDHSSSRTEKKKRRREYMKKKKKGRIQEATAKESKNTFRVNRRFVQGLRLRRRLPSSTSIN